MGQIYLAVMKLFLIYGCDTWVLNPFMKMVLGRFHHSVAYRLMGRQPRKGRDRNWFYPLLEYEMVEAGLQEVDNYGSLHQNTIAQYIVNRLIMDLCLAANWRPGSRVEMWW